MVHTGPRPITIIIFSAAHKEHNPCIKIPWAPKLLKMVVTQGRPWGWVGGGQKYIESILAMDEFLFNAGGSWLIRRNA